MKKKKSGPPKLTGPKVVPFTDRYVSQSLQEEYIAADNQVSDALAHQLGLADEIRERLLAGIEVEPGVNAARLELRRSKSGKKSLYVLKVN